MRILIVAMFESIHTARWLSQVAGQGWDIHLFSSTDQNDVHPDIRDVTVHHTFYGGRGKADRSVKLKGIRLYRNHFAFLGKIYTYELFPGYRAFLLRRLIDKLRPDIIHSLEIQHAGYLTLEAKKLKEGYFPPWILTNWGSDIYLFGRLAEHKAKIKEVLEKCDYYSCECRRDVRLAEAYGYKGRVLPVFPNTGGFDMEFVSRLRQPGSVSKRRGIMLKGYQTWAGRALVGLRALERCADILKGYEVVVYSATEDVSLAAELFQESTGIPVKVIPWDSPHHEILKMHGQARISIGLSISDAISTSFLEAMVMGSFPIQSWTSCADEWVEDGKTAILVPPEDPDVVEMAIRRALTDDGLVNVAAEKNYRLADEKLDHSMLKQKAIEMYKTVLQNKGH